MKSGKKRLTVTGNKLSKPQQAKLKQILQHKIVEQLISDIMANPPEVNLSKVEIKLPQGIAVEDVDVLKLRWNVTGGCETCSAIGGGCETCSAIGGGCETCSAIASTAGCETCSAIGGCDTCSAISGR